MADLFFGGGLNETDPFNISTDECIEGFNFLLDARRRNFRRRPVQDLKGTSTNAGEILGIMQMVDRNDASTTLVKSNNVIYEWDGGSTWTSKRTDLTTSSKYRSTYWSLDDLLVLNDFDKNDPLYKWDGTTVLRLKTGLTAGAPASVTQLSRVSSLVTAIHTSHGFSTGDLVTIAGATESGYNGEYEITVTSSNGYTYTISTTPATPVTTSITADLGVELKAKYSIVKDGRLWLFNVKTDSTDNPHLIAASKFEDVQNFDTSNRGKAQDSSSSVTGSDPFFLLTPDLKPINGVEVFYDEVIISTIDGALYRLTGTDPTDYNFVDYYKGSSATGYESLVNSGNDVFFVKRGGDIDRLSDTERSGDVSADDVSSFIPNTKLSIEDPIAVYDQTNQRVCWFNDGFVLLYDKVSGFLAPQISPWMKWTTNMPNQFSTKAASYIRQPDGTKYSIYWGDAAGNVYDFSGTGHAGDAGSYNVSVSRKTKYISELPSNFSHVFGRIQYRRAGSMNLTMAFNWGEEYNTTSHVVPLKGPTISGDPNFWGQSDFYWNEDDYWNEGTITGDSTTDNQVSTVGFSAVGASPGFFLTVSAETTVDFIVDKLTV